MNFEACSDKAIAEEIGKRIDQIRLEKNMTQEQIAKEIGLSAVSYRNLIKGEGKFQNIIAVIRALGRIDLVEAFIPDSHFSPLEMLKCKGKVRQRASGCRGNVGSTTVDDPVDLDW